MDDRFKFSPENGFEDESSFPNPKSGTESRKQMMKPLFQLRDFINELLPKLYTAKQVDQKISEAVFKSGSADMFKIEYDSNGDGIVDKADKALSIDMDDALSSKSEKPIPNKLIHKYTLHRLEGFTIAANSESYESIDCPVWDTEGDIAYRVTVAIDDVSEDDYLICTFDTKTQFSGVLSSIAETYNGGVYFYFTEIPDWDIQCIALKKQRMALPND